MVDSDILQTLEATPIKPKFKIVGTIAITPKELKVLKKKRTTYKMIEKRWYRLTVKKNSNEVTLKKIEQLKKKLARLEAKVGRHTA